PSGDAPRRAIFVHPSDELYGADRMLLQVLDGVQGIRNLDIEVWLPTDIAHGPHPLCVELERRGVRWQHRDIPVLRRAYQHPRHWLSLARSMRKTLCALRDSEADLLFCGTSACLLAAPLGRRAGIPARIVHIQEHWSGRDAT